MNISPTAKVASVPTGGAIATILLWLLETNGVTIPVEVAAATTSLVCALISWFVTDHQPPAYR
jgi:hypothetical protein